MHIGIHTHTLKNTPGVGSKADSVLSSALNKHSAANCFDTSHDPGAEGKEWQRVNARVRVP